ncbi:MAG: hypothetical protein J1G38_07290 [Clostridiales bacterium]|nr:hypothetical protein [Clostridiales bacterium]
MKDKTARVLAIIALVFMGIFVVTLTMTMIDYKMLGGGIGFVALASGAFAIIIFIALKADGRGYSITKINNEIEMEKIEKELAEQEAEQKEKENAENSDTAETVPTADGEETEAPTDEAPMGEVEPDGDSENFLSSTTKKTRKSK